MSVAWRLLTARCAGSALASATSMMAMTRHESNDRGVPIANRESRRHRSHANGTRSAGSDGSAGKSEREGEGEGEARCVERRNRV